MEKIHLDIHENILESLRKIKAAKDASIELHIPEGAVLFENSLNLKLLLKEAQTLNKELIFKTSDTAGKNIISNVMGDDEEVDSDFVSREVSVDSILTDNKKKISRKITLPSFKGISLPSISLKNKLPIALGLIVAFGIFSFGIYQYLWRVPKATIAVIVTSQPLIKSVEISVKPDVSSSVELKQLKGYTVQASTTETSSLVPTGSKIVGKKASGKIKIVNRTTEDKEFKEGENLFSTDNEDLFYLLNDDVKVPKASLEDPMDISSPLIPGTAEVDVTAEDIGKDYNLSKGEDLEFDDFDSSEYLAQVVSDIKGGESKTVKTVAKADMDKLSADMLKVSEEKGNEVISKNIPSDQILINGSVLVSLVKDEFSAKLNDETEELKLIQTVSYQGLSYKKTDLDAILKDMLKGFVPEGFQLLDSDMENNVEILGNSDATVLNLTQADLQVTIKAFVIPTLDEKELKEKLVGVSLSDAEKILGKVKNIKTYEIKIDPNVPIIRKIPSNIENIFVSIKKD